MGLLAGVLAGFGVEEVLRALGEASGLHTLMVAGLTVPLVFVRVARGRLLLHPRPSYGVLFPVLNASFLLAITTPGRVGAFLRPAWLVRHGVPAGATLIGMLAERLLDLFAMTVLFTLTLGWAMPALPAYFGANLGVARLLLLGGLIGGVATILALPWLRGVLLRWIPEDHRMGVRLREFIEALSASADALWQDGGRTARAAGWTGAQWGLGLAMGGAIAAGVDPSLARLDVVVSLWTGVMLANVLSPTPGGVGAYEAVGTAILVSFGADGPAAAAGVMTGHAATMSVQAVFGAHGFWRMGRDPASAAAMAGEEGTH